MHLEIVTPMGLIVQTPVLKVTADAPGGSFALLPRHIDFVTQVLPGIIVYQGRDGVDRYAGTGMASLVKQGKQVRIAARIAVQGDTPDMVRDRLTHELQQAEQTDRQERSWNAWLEAEMIRRFQTLGGDLR